MSERLNLTIAPDFELPDIDGRPVRLSAYRGQRYVVLVFNRSLL
jgi:peroxiredoxin